ncbi:MAG TPA: dihydrofolate reductase family protein [Pedococcus sp.]|nr:dihydrofolate reductase family protein [Pedococcus sp.]
MARLRYSAITSLDGYVVDAQGRFDWAAPTEALHRLVNEDQRSIGTYLYGRRMYEVMRYWDGPGPGTDESSPAAEYRRIWQAADKLVYSGTMTAVGTARTRLVRRFDPHAVRQLLEDSHSDLGIGGPTLAAEALRAGLVDEISLYLTPVSVGGGTPALPFGSRFDLRLREERNVGDVVVLRYAIGPVRD